MALQITNLSKRYDNNWVLRDISFEAAEGEIMGIYGLSGSGKSTLIRILQGSEDPNGGSVTFRGRDLTGESAEKRWFSIPHAPEESGWRGIFRPAKEQQTADGVGQFAAFKTALESASDKGVILLDNAFCDLDLDMRQQAFEELRAAVSERGLTVILATKDFDDVFELCDRVAILSNGQVEQIGPPQEVYDRPVSTAAARATGRNNIFAARRLTSSKADLPEFQTIEGSHRLFTEKADVRTLGAINRDVSLSIRPEHITLSFGASFPEDNLLKATITGVRLLGSTTLIELDAGGLRLEALVLRLVGLNPGDECMLGLPPDRIHVLRD